MASDKRVVVIGDIFADMVTNVVAYPNCGDGTYGTPLKRNGGGCGGNIAAGMGVLGLDTYMICRLGNDEVGHFLKDDMEKYNVKTDGIPLDDEYNSGIVVITVTPDGERTIWVLANGSAYEQLKPEDVRFMEKIEPDAIFISGIMMGVHPAEESIFAELPKWKGRATIYYDPNLRYPPDAIPPAIKASHQKMCALSDVVLTGKSEMDALGFAPEEGQIFVVKDGKRGSYLLDKDGNKVITVPATERVSVDATGAGDTYGAAFVCAQLEGRSLEESMKFATVAAGFAVTVPGARCMPEYQTIVDYINEKGI